MKHILNKFPGYALEDCDCALCLHHAGQDNPCPLETCCCADEKREAIEQGRITATPVISAGKAWSGTMPCPV